MRLFVFVYYGPFSGRHRFVVCASSKEEALKKIEEKEGIKAEFLVEDFIADPDNEIWSD